MQIDYTKCDPYWCVFRNIIDDLKKSIEKKKHIELERTWTPSVSKDSLPQSSLSYFKLKPHVIQDGITPPL